MGVVMHGVKNGRTGTFEVGPDPVFESVRIVVRRCPWHPLAPVPMVLWPQTVCWIGSFFHNKRGVAECTACGGEHTIYGDSGFVAGTEM